MVRSGTTPTRRWAAVAYTVSACSLMVSFSGAALAQSSAPEADTRAAQIVAAQQQKAHEVKAYEPNKAEKIFNWAMDSFLLAPQGFLPLITSIPKGDNVFHGGGIALGATYRGFIGEHAGWSATGLFSVPGYTHVDLSVNALRLAHGRLAVRGGGGFTSGAQIPFYGVGAGSSVDNATNFGAEMGYVGGEVRAHPRVDLQLVRAGGTRLGDVVRAPVGGVPVLRAHVPLVPLRDAFSSSV